MVTKGVRTTDTQSATGHNGDAVVKASALALAVCPAFWLINGEGARGDVILRTMSPVMCSMVRLM